MKKILLSTIIFAFALTAASAQMVTLGDTLLVAEGLYTDDEVEDHTAMTNVTQGALDLRWERESDDGTGPEEWESWVCTVPGNCGLPGTDGLDFTIAAGEVGEFQYHIRPNGVPGIGTFSIKIINTANEEVLHTITVTADLSALNANEIEEAQVKMFPNPTSDFFQLSNNTIIDQVEIFNILGKQVKTFGANEQSYFVGDLPKGIYMVRLTDEDSNSTKTMKLKKN